MKLITLVVLALLSSNAYSQYEIPHKQTPVYNEYFVKCVLYSDELMIKLHDAFIRVSEPAAVGAIDSVYSNSSEGTRNMLKEMVRTLYEKDMKFKEKLDKHFYSCLNEVNIVMENVNE